MFRKKMFRDGSRKGITGLDKTAYQEIRDLQSSPDIIKVTKMRGIIRARDKAARYRKVRKRV